MRTLKCVLLALPLAGCGGAGSFGTPFDASVATPRVDGTFDVDFLFPEDQQVVSDQTGNAVAYELGIVPDKGIRAIAGVVPGASVTALPAAGTATYMGRYALEGAEIIKSSSNEATSDPIADRSGAITLSVDFANGRFTGESDEVAYNTPNGRLVLEPLVLDGTFDGQDVTGTVSFYGVTGDLEGLIGGDELVGAFAGQSSTLIYTGGIVAGRFEE